MLYNSLRWIEEFQKKGAYWLHDGNAKRPHALLTFGTHSGGFFNGGLVIEDSFLLDYACGDLVELLEQQGVKISKIDRVVGPALGAITIAHDVARHIRKKSGRPCLSSYTEKGTESSHGRILFKRSSIKPGETVLLVEDVLTTGGSVEETSIAVTSAGGIVLPFVLVLMNRSGLHEAHGKKIIALVDQHMPNWEPRKCPLCAKGSEAIRPKGTENWARLNAVY